MNESKSYSPVFYMKLKQDWWFLLRSSCPWWFRAFAYDFIDRAFACDVIDRAFACDFIVLLIVFSPVMLLFY